MGYLYIKKIIRLFHYMYLVLKIMFFFKLNKKNLNFKYYFLNKST